MEITESMHPILQEIEGAYATAHRRLHNYKEWDEEHWGIIDDAFMSANNRIAALEAQAARYRAALQKEQDVEDHRLECLYCLHDDECSDRQRLIADAGVARVDILATAGPGGGVVGESDGA